MTAEMRSPIISPRLVIGLLIVVFGMALMLENLGLMGAHRIIEYWPVGLVVIGGLKLVQGPSGGSRVWGGILVIAGVVLLADLYLVIHVDELWRWWPLALVAFGLMIVMKAFRNPPQTNGEAVRIPNVFGGSSSAGTNAPGPSSPGSSAVGGIAGSASFTKPGSMAQTMEELAIWSGVERRVSTPNFKRADLTAVMGGIEFDLRQAGADQGEAVIEVFVLWGGIEITVPPDWAVSNEVTAIMGGAEDSSSGTQQSRNRLVVKGVVIMGGLEIKT
jgi:predicted membrane protein